MEAFNALQGKGDPLVLLDRALKIAEPVFHKVYADEWKYRKLDIETVISMAEKFDDLDMFLSTMTIDLSVDKTNDGGVASDSERPLTVSTVHSAKGNEWDCVYIPSFVEGHIPSRMASTPEEMEEEKRILFVAMTRPRKRLVVTKPAVGREGMISKDSSFQSHIIENFKQIQIGRSREPANFNLSMGNYDDIFIDVFD